jgi:hypothetical protein
MYIDFALGKWLLRMTLVIALLAAQKIAPAAKGQAAASEQITIIGEEVPSAYGAPPALSRSRFTPLINAYVLPPWAVYTGVIYQGDALRFNRPDHMFTQEIELGLPYSFSIEARYAFADWNKIPLNPTIFAEWKFGVGNILHDEGPPEAMAKGEAEEFLNERNPLPDAYEIRLLLSEEFFGRFEWALNGFFEQEVTGDRGREYGFAQSAVTPILLANERLKVGVEMQFTTFTDKGIREMPSYRFIVGPTIAWKPTANTRLDISPLIGATDDSPRISVFAVFSLLFGGKESEGEAPASTRNR